MAAAPSLLTNLGSTTAANVFQATPRPGITGTLSVAHGGTGATTVAGIKQTLSVEDVEQTVKSFSIDGGLLFGNV